MLVGFFLTALIFSALGIQGLYQLSRVSHEVRSFHHEFLRPMQDLGQARAEAAQVRSLGLVELMATTTPDRQAARRERVNHERALQALVATLTDRERSQEARAAFAKYTAAWQGYERSVENILAQGRDGSSGTAPSRALASLDSLIGPVDSALRDIMGLYQARAQRRRAQGRAAYGGTVLFQLLLGGLGLLTGLGVTYLMAKNVSRRVRDIGRVAQLIAQGDLTPRVACRSADEIGTLEAAFADMIGGLRNLVRKVHWAGDQVALAASKITAATRRSAKDTEAAASAIEEVTA
ncbi:MAG: MCP four helix bundle domain-containing protein, partial [Candidatus Methylomirabilales bacterium]